MPSAEDTRLVKVNPATAHGRKIVRVETVADLEDLASLDPTKLERLLDNWHGRKEQC